jgi:His-Xaa-Ser system radical SAM maturase HxsC
MGNTMIPLRGRAAATQIPVPLDRTVWRLETNAPRVRRSGQAFLIEDNRDVPEGFDLYIGKHGTRPPTPETNYVELPQAFDYLAARDVVGLSGGGERIRVLWRDDARLNSILLTERCDHYCLMCSQPPKAALDDWLMDDAFDLIRLLPTDTRGLAFTGGEPTLYGDRLIELLRLCRNLIPEAGVHVLSNGRRFADHNFATSWAAIDNPNLMVGIPIYGSEPSLHDYVVQSEGAFDATIRGILNLAQLEQPIEIRVVIHKQTAPHLVEIAEFIARNLPFVNQVALMGLEVIGFARANMNDVWIDPIDYRKSLTHAVQHLDRHGVKTMVYNHQLCLIDREIWPYTVKSISDWKNEYHPACLSCGVIHRCGGFFYSAKYRVSDNIAPITDTNPAMLELA